MPTPDPALCLGSFNACAAGGQRKLDPELLATIPYAAERCVYPWPAVERILESNYSAAEWDDRSRYQP